MSKKSNQEKGSKMATYTVTTSKGNAELDLHAATCQDDYEPCDFCAGNPTDGHEADCSTLNSEATTAGLTKLEWMTLAMSAGNELTRKKEQNAQRWEDALQAGMPHNQRPFGLHADADLATLKAAAEKAWKNYGALGF